MAHEEFQNCVALITGASQGIGRGVARRLAREGTDVAVGYRSSRDAAESLCQEIEAMGRRAICVGGDVADTTEVARIVKETQERLGPIDILFSNAGAVKPLELDEIDVATWDRTMQEHVRAAFLLAQQVAPAMCERRWGRIMINSSLAAFIGGFVGAHYATAKGALIGLMHYLASYLGPYNITANAIAPSLIETGALASLDGSTREDIKKSIPAQRFGTVDEAADLIVSMLGNGYVSGQTIVLDGGRYPR
mgnify:CR=1 FL=1